MMGYLSFFELDNYKIINDAKGSHFIFKAKDVIAKIIKDNDYAPDMNISIFFHYVQKINSIKILNP
jgi:hypothetical protein